MKLRILATMLALLPFTALATTTPLVNPVMSGMAIFNGQGAGATLPTPTAGTLFQLIAGTGAPMNVELDAFASSSDIYLRRSQGTPTAPTALITGETIGALLFSGYNGTQYPIYSAYIAGETSQNWTSSAQGSFLAIETTPNNSITPTLAAIFGQDQSLTEYGQITANLNTAPALGLQGLAGQILGEFVATDGNAGRVIVDSFGSNSIFTLRRANGTNASPSGVAAGQSLGTLAWNGYTSSGAYTTSAPAFISGVAQSNWSSTDNQAGISFFTSATGTTAGISNMILWGSGGLTLSHSLIATDPGAGSLLVSGIFEANDSGGTPLAIPNGTLLELAGAASANATLNLDSYSGVPVFGSRRADGTVGTPTAIQNGDVLLEIGTKGYGATIYSNTLSVVSVVAAQNWTDTANGLQVLFNTIPNGATGGLPALLLGQDQSATFYGAITGVTAFTSSGNIQTNSGNLITTSGNLSIAGTSSLTGLLTAHAGITISSGQPFQVGTTYAGGVEANTGTIDIKDATGTTYHVLVHN